MKILYVGVVLDYEIYSSFLHACSFDKHVVQSKLEAWIAPEKEYGNAVAYKICEIECSDRIYNFLTYVQNNSPVCMVSTLLFYCKFINANDYDDTTYIDDVVSFVNETNKNDVDEVFECEYYASI